MLAVLVNVGVSPGTTIGHLSGLSVFVRKKAMVVPTWHPCERLRDPCRL